MRLGTQQGVGVVTNPYVIPPPLDGQPSCWACFGLRKLRRTYTGNALWVRRTSDNVEVEVGFDASGEVSMDSPIADVTEFTASPSSSGDHGGTATLAGFSSSTDVHVVKWLDQSGNDRDVHNTTGAQQPKLISSGSFVTDPINFDGTDDWFTSASRLDNSNDRQTILAVVKKDTGTGSMGLVSCMDNFNDGSELFATSNYWSYRLNTTDLEDFSGGVAQISNTSKELVVASYTPAESSNEQKLRVNGSLILQQNCTANLNVGGKFLAISKRVSTSSLYEWNGGISEIIIWQEALTSAQLSYVEKNVIDHHNI